MLLAADQTASADREPLSYRIVEAVADAEGVDPTDIEPPTHDALYDVVNPEALDSLFAPREDGSTRTQGQVAFEFCGYDVVVHSDGQVDLSR